MLDRQIAVNILFDKGHLVIKRLNWLNTTRMLIEHIFIKAKQNQRDSSSHMVAFACPLPAHLFS